MPQDTCYICLARPTIRKLTVCDPCFRYLLDLDHRHDSVVPLFAPGSRDGGMP